MRTVSRSSGEIAGRDAQVFLGDSMGELTMLYAAADVAFVGGSLVRVGGHNLLEPAALGLPALTGPYNFNAPDIAELLIGRGPPSWRRNAREIAAEIVRLLGDPAERAPPRRLWPGRRSRAIAGRSAGCLRSLSLLAVPPPGAG